MADALSRLFGRSSKKPATGGDRSNPGGTAHSVPETTNEDEGFTVVAAPGGSSGPIAASPRVPSPQLPPDVRPYSSSTLTSQTSVTGGSHALDGVPFVLSSRCQVSSASATLSGDPEIRTWSTKLESISALLESANYDFRQEKAVIAQDITATMRRMHT